MDAKLLLPRCIDAVVEAVDRHLAQTSRPGQQFEWLILEYTVEGAFPPTLGLANTTEATAAWAKDEHPLAVYNAADLEMFTEGDDWPIDFSQHDGLFDEVNESLEALSESKANRLVFDAYVVICQQLTSRRAQWKGLALAPDFHVLARDFEINNELKYLQKLLPPEGLKRLKKRIRTHESQLQSQFENDETVQKVRSTCGLESGRFEELDRRWRSLSTTTLVSETQVIYLRPFKYEETFHRPAQEGMSSLSAGDLPQTDHFEYDFDGYELASIRFVKDAKTIWQVFATHTPTEVTWHRFFLKSGVPEFEDFARLTCGNGVPVKYEKYSEHSFLQVDYDLDEQNRVVSGHSYRVLLGSGVKSEGRSTHHYEYDQGALARIVSLESHEKGFVYFSRDNTFVETAIEVYAGHYRWYLEKVYASAAWKGKRVDALLFEIDPHLPMAMMMYFVIGKEFVSIVDYSFYENDFPLMNLTRYLSTANGRPAENYFSEEQAQEYSEQAYQAVFARCLEWLHQNVNPKGHIFYQSIYDSRDAVLTQLAEFED